MTRKELPELDISLHILDVAMNSLDAGASFIDITVDENDEKIAVSVTDNGVGMDADILKKAADNGFSTKPGNSGLGLFLLRRAAERTGGSFSVRSEKDRGTIISAVFMKNEKCPPTGDLPATTEAIIAVSEATDIRVIHNSPSERVCFDTREIRNK